MRDCSERTTRRNLFAKVMSAVLIMALAVICAMPAVAAFAVNAEDEAVENVAAVDEAVSGEAATAEGG